MIYQEHRPNPLLLPYIETYWTSSGFVEGKELFKVLPDGCVDILFSFAPTSPRDNLIPFLPHIIGTMTTYSEVCYQGQVDMLGIRFKPAGITAFICIPIYEFTNLRIDMSLLDSLFDKSFYDSLPEKAHIKDKIAHIDTYFTRKLQYIFELEPRIVYAVDLIRKSQGTISLSKVASQACLSPRHFERKFKTAVGISPKMFSKVTKFEHALSILQRQNNDNLLSIAIDCGYYDHTHLIKDFKALSGDTPSFFRR
jgi:AraC-like DNA-binding protein